MARPDPDTCARPLAAGALLALAAIALSPVAAQPPAAAGALFTEAGAEVGLDFVHFNGMSGEFYLVENLGGGGALFDYDGDGDLDVYLAQGNMLGEGKTLADASFPPTPGRPLTDRLYRNDLTVGADGSRTLRFTDVTQRSRIDAPGYGMGVAVGDIDNDGHPDLYVANFGANQLWHNNGDGTFSDVTAQAGVDEPSLSVTAVFLDYDRDGWLDLFVGNYVEFTTAGNKVCHAPTSARDYCGPTQYGVLPDRLFRNRGDGTFVDVTEAAGLTKAYGTALGAVAADFNGDGWFDLYVANDNLPNQLWVNQRDGSFRDEALLAGAAVNMDGIPEASMGVDAADFDGDGDEDLFMTHFVNESNTLYINDGQGWFEDRTVATGLAAPSKAYTSFGTAWFDYDNDGWLDLFIANGGVNVIRVLARAGDPYPLHQPNQLFRNLGNTRFEEVTARAGAAFERSEVSRGTAFGDVDNDGDTDVLVINNNGPVRLLVNKVGQHKHWLGLRLVDTAGRDALGARVALHRPDRSPLWRRVRTDGSYASANDPRVLLGLGDSARIDRVQVHWPSGHTESWPAPAVDAYVTLREGQGREAQAK